LAKKLQNDIEQYNEIVKLKKPEVEAVSQLLRAELVREGKKSFWIGFSIKLLFFILGAVASILISILMK